jgi:predicted nucleic acid-binding protein
MKYYADSCIWMDLMLERSETNFFETCFNNNEELLISDILIDELTRYLTIQDLNMIIKLFDSKKLLIKVKSTNIQRIEAQKIALLRKIPSGDTLHAIIARDNNAILVTRDKHFLLLKDICKIELH